MIINIMTIIGLGFIESTLLPASPQNKVQLARMRIGTIGGATISAKAQWTSGNRVDLQLG